ncbi:UspA domain-containing protein [Caldicellulosiruptor obsidiansis OB47]|uniref:UspA domain-containing protein n=1 Tax=Caldicellulosiruptor obsidiansis (strain ATCC BAA-2073 / JCM 16842 / OB47) TaxID=608506 RepID=D9TGH4_CALOO|nr:universal stress protein [Caldicellulosiruptor obsidiansis]ADL43294.1 UspA domain-containing protein [Caldicellulosiruptor obsidiansis OB47]
MYKKIVVAYDGSEHSKKGFEVALELAKMFESSIHIVSVAHIPDFVETKDELNGILNDARQYYEKIQQQAIERAKSEGIEINCTIVPGHPANGVVSFAESIKADLIIVGQRGRSGVARYIVGNVAENIVRHAHCSVMVIK